MSSHWISLWLYKKKSDPIIWRNYKKRGMGSTILYSYVVYMYMLEYTYDGKSNFRNGHLEASNVLLESTETFHCPNG